MTIGFSLVRSTKYQELMPDPFDLSEILSIRNSSHQQANMIPKGFRVALPMQEIAAIWNTDTR